MSRLSSICGISHSPVQQQTIVENGRKGLGVLSKEDLGEVVSLKWSVDCSAVVEVRLLSFAETALKKRRVDKSWLNLLTLGLYRPRPM